MTRYVSRARRLPRERGGDSRTPALHSHVPRTQTVTQCVCTRSSLCEFGEEWNSVSASALRHVPPLLLLNTAAVQVRPPASPQQ